MRLAMAKEFKILYVGSSGGHLLELLKLRTMLLDFQCVDVWVTFRKTDAEERLDGAKVYWCRYPTTRNIRNFLRNSLQAISVLWRERPDIIVSTGAAVAVSYAWLGLLFGAKTVFVEATNRVKTPSLTGRLIYPIAKLFCVQWPGLMRVYPRSQCIGPLV